MIFPNVRTSFGRVEAGLVLGLLTRGDSEARGREEDRLREEGFDAILDDPRTLNAVLTVRGVSAVPARLVFYLLVRHALLEVGFGDRTVADYLAALLVEFGRRNRAYQVEEGDAQEFRYLVDQLPALRTAQGRRALLMRAHLGDFSLWLSGLFPDWIEGRRQRRGAPGLAYYEEVGTTGYRLAADCADAEKHGLDRVYRACAENFPRLRSALNRVSDRHLFPAAGDPLDRLLRQVADDFRLRVN
ncbi:MAG TPA: hypothetical protein VFQ38_09555 [Longimicrobiales bacterium]|nr:hypothetical protein [Longimicrobiales bacterium]